VRLRFALSLSRSLSGWLAVCVCLFPSLSRSRALSPSVGRFLRLCCSTRLHQTDGCRSCSWPSHLSSFDSPLLSCLLLCFAQSQRIPLFLHALRRCPTVAAPARLTLLCLRHRRSVATLPLDTLARSSPPAVEGATSPLPAIRHPNAVRRRCSSPRRRDLNGNRGIALRSGTNGGRRNKLIDNTSAAFRAAAARSRARCAGALQARGRRERSGHARTGWYSWCVALYQPLVCVYQTGRQPCSVSPRLPFGIGGGRDLRLAVGGCAWQVLGQYSRASSQVPLLRGQAPRRWQRLRFPR